MAYTNSYNRLNVPYGSVQPLNLGYFDEGGYQYQAPTKTVIGSSVTGKNYPFHPISRAFFDRAQKAGKDSIGKLKLGGRDKIAKPWRCVMPVVKDDYVNDPICQDDFYTNQAYFEGVVKDYYDFYRPAGDYPTWKKIVITGEKTVTSATKDAVKDIQEDLDAVVEEAEKKVKEAFTPVGFYVLAGVLGAYAINKIVDEVL